MRLLFVGGTRFVGLAMAREALRRGHQVDLFHRGRAGADSLPGARHRLGDRNGDLSALAQGEWDAVIDTCGYRPGEIHAVADALQGRGGQYLFVSSISVYAESVGPGSDESAPRVDTRPWRHDALDRLAIDAESYGPLKALCEDVVFERHADALVLRPTYVIGPDDYTQRFGEWVRRIAAGGEIVAPGPGDEPIQVIDARDLAAFAVGAVAGGLHGVFNVAGPAGPLSFGEMLEGIVAAVGPIGTRLRWIPATEASAADFPLWGGGSYSGLGAVSAAAAFAQGLQCRPLAESTRDVRTWLRDHPAA